MEALAIKEQEALRAMEQARRELEHIQMMKHDTVPLKLRPSFCNPHSELKAPAMKAPEKASSTWVLRDDIDWCDYCQERGTKGYYKGYVDDRQVFLCTFHKNMECERVKK